MNRVSQIITVAAAFTAGICTGLMLAPQSGKNLRRKISLEARSQLRAAEKKMDMVESQLTAVNDRLQNASKDLGDRVREAANEAAEEILPDITKDSDNWNLTKGEVESELRNLSNR